MVGAPRYGLLTILLAVLICGCSGSGSPLTPDGAGGSGQHVTAIQAALEGVEVQNTDLLSIAIDGRELLPWGLKDVVLEPEGSHLLEIELSDPDREIVLEVEGASLLVNGAQAEAYEGPATAVFSISGTEERVAIHLELPGEPSHRRDITIRTAPSEHLLLPDRPAIVQYTDPVTNSAIEIAERELLIGFRAGTDLRVVEALVGVLDCEILRAIPSIDVYRLRIPPDEAYERMSGLYESSSVVEFAEVNCVRHITIVPNDTYEHHEYGNGLMRLYDAWDITTGTSSTTIAVVDSGVMRDHPDLYQNVINGEDFIWPIGDGLGGATPGDGVDNDEDGRTDEVVGHGTHCAGIIGAVGNNSEGVSGHSWSTNILPLRVFPTDGDSGAWPSDIAEAITYAADHGATGISLSLGSPYPSSSVESAVNYAWGRDCVIVAAAGNNNWSSPFYPAAYTNVVAVASTYWVDKKSGFSNYGGWVDCCAPGEDIISTYFYTHGGDPWSVPEIERYAFMSGTSMSCPQVSGLVALVASWFPAYANSEIVQQILLTADNIDSLNPGYIGKLGAGRINDYRALAQALEPDFVVVRLSTDDDNPLLSQGNRDGFLNPGEIIEFRPTVRNTGLRPAPDCRMSIHGGGGFVETLFVSVLLGNVGEGQTVTPADPLIFRISPDIVDDTDVNLTLRFTYGGGDPIDIPYTLTVRTDMGVVDTISCSGQGLFAGDLPKGTTGVPALSFTIEGDLDYATLDELTIHQTGTASSSSFTEVQLWLDADESGEFSPVFDTRIAYKSYYHPGLRGGFDDLNDPEAGFGSGVDYEDFPPVYFDAGGTAHFYECVLPTTPGTTRTVFVVIGIRPDATSGETVQIGILSKDDVVVRPPDQVNPLDFPIQSNDVLIAGTWAGQQQVSDNGPDLQRIRSLSPETAYCPVTGNIYTVFHTDRNAEYDIFFHRSTDGGETFEEPLQIGVIEDPEGWPAIKVDSMGTIHVVYHNDRLGLDEADLFYARSYDFGQTFDPPVRLTSEPGRSSRAKLAVGPDDSLNLVWRDDKLVAGEFNIYFMRSDDGGDTWTSPLQLNSSPEASNEAAIAVGGDGAIHAIWHDYDGAHSANLFYSRSTNDGQTFSPPVLLSTGVYQGWAFHGDVGADNSGNVYVAFEYYIWDVPSEVCYIVSNDSGQSWNPVVEITDDGLGDRLTRLNVRPDGSFVDIVWSVCDPGVWNVYHIYSTDGLQSFSTPEKISQTIRGAAVEPVVLRDDGNDVFVCWQDKINDRGCHEIFYNRKQDGVWLGQKQLTDVPIPDKLLAWGPETAECPITGNLYLTFCSNRSGHWDIFLRRSTDGGETFEDPSQIGVTEDPEGWPNVKVDSTGTIHLVYHNDRLGYDESDLFYARSYDFGQSFEPPVQLTSDPGRSASARLAIGPDDSLNLVWRDDKLAPGEFNIYFMRSDDGGDTWGTSVQLSSSPENGAEAAIAVGGDGVIHAIWHTYLWTHSANLFYSRSTDNGQSFQPATLLSTGPYQDWAFHGDVGADDGGNAYIAFEYYVWDVPSEVCYLVSNNSGQSWDPIVEITDDGLGDRFTNIHVNPAGTYVDIVWSVCDPGIWNVYHAYSTDGLATLSDPVKISQTIMGVAIDPVVIRGSNRNVHVFWKDVTDANGREEIFYNRYLY